MPRHLLQSPSYELSWQPERGTFRLESPGRLIEGGPGLEFLQHGHARTIAAAELTAGRAQESQLEDAHGQAQELHVYYQELFGLALSMRIRLYANRPFVLVELSVTNVGPDAVDLRRFYIETTPDGIGTSAPVTGGYVNGWQSWSESHFCPIGTRPSVLSLPERWLQGPMVHNAATPRLRHQDRLWSETCGAYVTEREALIGGIVSTADQFGQMWMDLRPAHSRIVLQTQMDDISLAAGESRHSEWFYLEWVPLPCLDPFAQYAHAVARQMRVNSRWAPMTGWCSWYMYGNQVGEAQVMENLASAALLGDEIPLHVLQLDDGYQEAWGDWRTRNDRFPHSLGWLADRMRGSGFLPGLWIAPLIVERKSQVAREHPEWLLRGPKGRPAKAGLVSSFVGRVLDATHPEVLRHIGEIINDVVHEWGYDYLKLDFLYAAALMGRRHDRQMTRAQALRRTLEVIRAAAGDRAYLAACGAPLGPAIGLVDAMRIGPDTAPNWQPKLGLFTGLVERNHSLPSLRNSLTQGMTRAWTHGRWWVSDPDVLMMRDEQTALTAPEVLAQATLIGLTGGTTLLSDDLDDLPPERRQLVSTLFPPLLDGFDVPSLFESATPETAIVPVARPWGRWRLVALFNWSEDEVERELPASVHLDERKAYHLVDFWAQRYLMMGPGALRPVMHIPPHGVALLGLRSVKDQPHVVGSTFHISQGREITLCELSNDSLSVTIELGRVAEGAVWFALPARPRTVHLNGKPLGERAVRAIASGVWAVNCRIAGSGTLNLNWSPRPPA